jgi:hypothetical protein
MLDREGYPYPPIHTLPVCKLLSEVVERRFS